MQVLFLIILLYSSSIAYANKIDELKTEAAIARFVDTVSGFRAVFPTSVPSNLSSIRYLKTDIDKNGLTDLLVNDRMIFAIIDMGNDKFELKYVGTAHRESRLVSIDTAGPTPILLIKRQNGYKGRDPDFSAIPDSIIYKFNGFIEHNGKPQRISIDSITISRQGCFGSCPIYDLVIDHNRRAVLHGKRFVKPAGIRRAVIDQKSLDELNALISYLNPDSLSPNYDIGWTDNPTADVAIAFNGHIKKIHDYGLEGTLGLQQLYLLIDRLIANQQWEP